MVGEFQRYDDMMPLGDMKGRVDQMALYAGQSVVLVTDVQPAAQILASILSDAQSRLARWGGGSPSAV